MQRRFFLTYVFALTLLLSCEEPDGDNDLHSVDAVAAPASSPDATMLEAGPNGEFEPSFVAVLANADEYHGKKIRLEGFIHVEFEGDAIYLSKEHADHGITSNGFWVEFDRTAIGFDGKVGPERFHRKWVLIEGVFDKDGRGHLGAWSGTIMDIDRIYEIEHRYEDLVASSPQSAWSLLLAAMRNRDQESIEKLTTSNGLTSLESTVQSGDERDDVFSRLGDSWSQLEVRWIKQDARSAAAYLGPEAKEAGLVFNKDKEGWKLERWAPGR